MLFESYAMRVYARYMGKRANTCTTNPSGIMCVREEETSFPVSQCWNIYNFGDVWRKSPTCIDVCAVGCGWKSNLVSWAFDLIQDFFFFFFYRYLKCDELNFITLNYFYNRYRVYKFHVVMQKNHVICLTVKSNGMKNKWNKTISLWVYNLIIKVVLLD